MSDIQELLYNENLIKDMRYIISALAVIITYGFFSLFRMNLRERAQNTIYQINGKLKIAKRLKIMDKIDKIRRMGAVDDFPHIDEPIWYLAYHFLAGLTFGGLAYFVASFFTTTMYCIFASFGGFVIGWIILEASIKSKNKKANAEITSDVLVLLNILVGQITGGAYTGTALGECADVVRNKRLRKALEEFDRDIRMGNKTLVEAVKDLEFKFADNIDIDNLCMVLVQNEESGHSRNILSDLSAQILSSERAVYEQAKERLDRFMTYAVLILFGDIVGYVTWLFMSSIVESINFVF